MKQSEPFWMIYGLGMNAPAVRHDQFENAKRECERLARNNPGIRFYILATVASAERNDILFRTINPDDTPF